MIVSRAPYRDTRGVAARRLVLRQVPQRDADRQAVQQRQLFRAELGEGAVAAAAVGRQRGLHVVQAARVRAQHPPHGPRAHHCRRKQGLGYE